jgi:hypothetical protein
MQALVARRAVAVMTRQRRRRPAPPSSVEQSDGFHTTTFRPVRVGGYSAAHARSVVAAPLAALVVALVYRRWHAKAEVASVGP